ncbi:hypothetical protein GCM10027610_001690 [Dactylosporangium cerinum]
MTFTLRSRQVYLPDGPRPATVTVHDGRIAAVGAVDDPCDGELRDLGDLVLLPGLVDTHVHVNEPGRTEWEGFATATRAAAAGGVTTIVDMPLNSLPPTTSVAALREKQAAATGQCYVDVGFWGGAIPGNAGDLPALHDAGVFGFKSFLVDSGVPEFPPLDRAGLAAAFAAVDALFIVHAEDPGQLRDAAASRAYADFLASRPPAAEVTAVGTALAVARAAGARVHILHLSAADALPLLREAAAGGVRVTAETCPHYLTLDGLAVPDGATEFKCCPPIRDPANQDGLWAGLADGTISIIVSDHSPSTPTSSDATAATSPPHGAASPPCSSGSAPCGRRRRTAASPSPTWCGGWRWAPPTSSACATRAASNLAPTPTSSRSPPTSPSSSTGPPCTTSIR